MSNAPYHSDGGSSTESEDDDLYDFSTLKQEPQQQVAATEATAMPVPTSSSDVSIKSEAETVAVKLEATAQPAADSTSTTPPRCSACGYPLLVVPQAQELKAKTKLDCKCCLLVLPSGSFSKTQRGREQSRKCKACTGNVVGASAPLVTPTRAKPSGLKPIPAKEKRRNEASAVFENQVARLKMARGALQRKRDEASKLKMTQRRQEYEEQLDKEEKELERKEVLLKRRNGGVFKELMQNLVIKKPLLHEKKRKKAPKRAAANKPSKKQKGPAVDSSVYVQSASATSDEVPARRIPTRASTRAQAAKVKTEMKSEPVKVEQIKVEL